MDYSTSDYRKALGHIKLTAHQVEVLATICSYPGACITPTLLSQELGYERVSRSNLDVGGLGKIFRDAFLTAGIDAPFEEGEDQYWWFICDGYVDGAWVLSEALVAALVENQIIPADILVYDEVSPTDAHDLCEEGRAIPRWVNAYERKPKNRIACIRHWGTKCYACGFDFAEVYGTLGVNYIEVHHEQQLSSVGPGYTPDPVKEMKPLCSNCHAMIHRKKEPISIQELKGFLSSAMKG